MKQQIQQYRDKFEALSLRERGIVVLAVLGILYTMWSMAIMNPMQKTHKKQVKEITKWQGQISDIDSKINAVSVSMTKKDDSDVLSRINNLKNEIQNISAIKKDITVGFIRPSQMSEVLRGLLRKEPGLELVRFESLEVASLFPQEDENKKVSQGQEGAAENKIEKIAAPKIYKHGAILEFKGDYTSTVNYLRSLESLPWKFYWDGVGYEVLKHPKALVTINVFTLSLDKGWIGV